MRYTLAVIGVFVFFMPVIYAQDTVHEKSESSETPPGQSISSTKPSRPANAAFVLTPEIVRAAVARGESLAKKGKKWEDIKKDYKKSYQTPRWDVNKGKKEENCSVFFHSLGALPVILASYQSSVLHESNTIPDGLLNKDLTLTNLEFEVSLQSLASDIVNRENRVQAESFYLTDDKGNRFEAKPGSTVGKVTFEFKKVVTYENQPVFERIKITRTTRAFSGKDYKVIFPMFDAEGEPIISADVKKITLHIRTPTLALCAEYDLKPLVFK